MHHLTPSKMGPRPGLRAVRSTGLVLFALAILASTFSTAAETPSKVFRIGHLAAGGRTSDVAPPGPLRPRRSRTQRTGSRSRLARI